MSGNNGHYGLLMAASSGPVYLDAYTTNLWGAYSLAKLLTTSSSGAVDAINTTSSSTANIGWGADNGLDQAALATLGSSNSVAVTAFKNQQGTAGRDFGANTSALRPAIYTSGSYLGSIQFDGSTDGMVSAANSGTPTAFTVFFRGKLRTAGTNMLLEHSINYNGGKYCAAFYDSSAMQVGFHSGASAANQYAVSKFNGLYPNDTVQMWRFDRAQSLGALSTRLAVNGSLQTRSSSNDVGTVDANFAAAAWYLGSRAQSSIFAPINVHTLLIYEGAVSDADAAAISSIIASLP